MAPGYGCVPRVGWLSRYSTAVIRNGTHFWYKADGGLWWPGKISASATTDGVHLVPFFYYPGPIKLPLTPVRYTTSTGAVRGSWCLQVHLASAFARGVQDNGMNLEAKPWIAGVLVTAAPDSFPFFWVSRSGFFLLGLFLVFFAFLGWVWGVFFSNSVLPTPSAQCRGWSGISGRSMAAQGTLSGFLGWIFVFWLNGRGLGGFLPFFVLLSPPPPLSAGPCMVWVMGRLN